MPVSVVRRGAWVVGAAVVVAAIVLASLPLIASTQIVRDGIAYQMTAWSGYRVRLDDAPDIRVWPTFRAVLNDVTFQGWGDGGPVEVLHAERIEMDLSAIAALRGEVVFTRMRLIRPVLHLAEEDGRLHLPSPRDWGRLPRSLAVARNVLSTQTGANGTGLPDDVFGTIEFLQGRVIVVAGEEARGLITSLSGSFDWPALNRNASLNLNGIWHGENVRLSASSPQPLVLLAGRNAPLNVALQAAPANVSFEGNASTVGGGFVDGRIEIAAPSLSRLAEWTQLLTLSGRRHGPVAMSAKVVGDARRLKFQDTTLNIDTSTAEGLLDLAFTEGGPLVAGTLAFDNLDLRAMLNLLGPFSQSPLVAHDMPGGGYDFDLRFSAVNASYGEARLANVAAAAKVKDGFFTFDISDAAVFGGTIQISAREDRRGKDSVVELRASGDRIETDRLADFFGYQRLVPQAPGAFSLVLKGYGKDFESVLATADGSMAAVLGPGRIPGLSLDAFFKRSEAGDFFSLDALEDGALPIDGVEIKANVSKGVAQLEKAEARSGPYVISLDGLIPLAGRALALYGNLAAAEGADSRLSSPLVFFVGGAWSAPLIASFLPPSGTNGE